MPATLTDSQSHVRTAAERYLSGLGELLRHYEQRGLEEEEITSAEAHFAEALARYRFCPPSGKMIRERLHVMVFGGAGAGKSTVANIAVGFAATRVNAQAGYTRHPVALFQSDTGQVDELLPSRLGSLRRHDGTDPENVDEDRFGWRNLHEKVVDPGFLRRYVVWDCPDLTSKNSDHYQARVIEIAALADIGVYVASDERYNDELPTNFLQGLLQAGKPIVVVLTKASEADSAELEQLFEDSVANRLEHRERIAAVLSVPWSPTGRAEELWSEEFYYGQRLRVAIERALGDFPAARKRSLQTAGEYLTRLQGKLLDPLRRDVGEWHAWKELVRSAANKAVRCYEHEYLAQVRYQEFQDVLSRILGHFELNGKFDYLQQGLEVLRTPYRLTKSCWQRFFPIVSFGGPDEDRTLQKVRGGMLDSLQIATASRVKRHRFWVDLHESFETVSSTTIEPLYHAARNRQRQELEQCIQEVARSISEGLQSHPNLVKVLKATRLGLDLLVLLLALYLGLFQIHFLMAVILALIGFGAVEDLSRFACQRYINRYRSQMHQKQKENIRELIQVAYIDELLKMPHASGGKLQALAQLVEQLPIDLQEALQEHCGLRNAECGLQKSEDS